METGNSVKNGGWGEKSLLPKQVIKELNGQDVGQVTQLDVDVTKTDDRGRQPGAKVLNRYVTEKSRLVYGVGRFFFPRQKPSSFS